MTDPISGKVASQAAQQASEISENQSGVDDSSGSKKASFDDVLSDVQGRQADQADGAGAVDGPQQVDEAQRGEAVEAAGDVQKSEGPAESRLREFVEGVSTDEAKLDKMMSKSLSGGDMSKQELLQMQALIYNYSQKVELASKAVSNVASGMKQIMNTQV